MGTLVIAVLMSSLAGWGSIEEIAKLEREQREVLVGEFRKMLSTDAATACSSRIAFHKVFHGNQFSWHVRVDNVALSISIPDIVSALELPTGSLDTLLGLFDQFAKARGVDEFSSRGIFMLAGKCELDSELLGDMFGDLLRVELISILISATLAAGAPLTTPMFAGAQEVIVGLIRISPAPILSWCFDSASERLKQCDRTASLTLTLKIAIVRNGLVASCWIAPEDIDLEKRTEGICELGKGTESVDLSGWLVDDTLRDLKAIVERMPVGTYWQLFTENDKAAFQSMLRVTRELFESLPKPIETPP